MKLESVLSVAVYEGILGIVHHEQKSHGHAQLGSLKLDRFNASDRYYLG